VSEFRICDKVLNLGASECGGYWGDYK